jgi:hypothetical protein
MVTRPGAALFHGRGFWAFIVLAALTVVIGIAPPFLECWEEETLIRKPSVAEPSVEQGLKAKLKARADALIGQARRNPE